jgi:iron uptake system component EfeO
MPRHPARPRCAAALAVLAAAAAALTSCSSSGGGDGAGTAGANTADPTGAVSHTANVTITAANGCTPDHTTFAAGAVDFQITNKDATAVSEVELLDGEQIIGEKENLPPGLHGSFSVRVDAGKYTLYCPGASPEKSTIIVAGKAATNQDTTTAALLKTGAQRYADYVDTQVANLRTAVQKLDHALHGTDLAAAQDAYLQARPFYERIEPVAESFTVGPDNLDADIDLRIQDVKKGEPWTGFHPIERGLFQRRSLSGLAGLGDGLVANVKKLQGKTTGLEYQPFELANGAGELLDEVATSKISGEEEHFAHSDLSDFQANDEGAEQAFAALEPGLRKIDAALTDAVATRFKALDTLIAKYRTDANASGFVFYGELTKADKRAFSEAVTAVQAPLSKVASKVARG